MTLTSAVTPHFECLKVNFFLTFVHTQHDSGSHLDQLSVIQQLLVSAHISTLIIAHSYQCFSLCDVT